MKKADLAAEIEDLKRRIAELEAQPRVIQPYVYPNAPYVYYPYPNTNRLIVTC